MATTLDTDDFKPGQNVTYVPYHAHGDRGHKDCEHGVVSSTNDTYVFVRFSVNGTAQACKPDQLVKG